MVEHQGFWRNFVPHVILIVGIAIIAFPVYLCFVGSTHPQDLIANGRMPVTPGPLFFETYYKALFIGTSGTTRQPVWRMLMNRASAGAPAGRSSSPIRKPSEKCRR